MKNLCETCRHDIPTCKGTGIVFNLDRNPLATGKNADAVLECDGYAAQLVASMKANEYQALAGRTLIDAPDFQITPDQVMLVWNAIGLAGEAGEVAELAKKQIFHQQGLDREKWKKELGDVMWYVAACCTRLDLTLEDVMQHNAEKLRARFPDGYSPERTTVRDGLAA